MLELSHIIITHPEIKSFQDLLRVVGQYGARGQVLLTFDLKPDFPDTPRDWQDQLEHSFMWSTS